MVDDSARLLFDSDDSSFVEGTKSTWPWVAERPAGERLDWYFLGYGCDYKQAPFDHTLVAGKIPLPPRFAFGAWWSRYWVYSDQELAELVRGFHEHNIPLDVLVIDMEWHKTMSRHRERRGTRRIPRVSGRAGQATVGIVRCFPTPNSFSNGCTRKG